VESGVFPVCCTRKSAPEKPVAALSQGEDAKGHYIQRKPPEYQAPPAWGLHVHWARKRQKEGGEECRETVFFLLRRAGRVHGREACGRQYGPKARQKKGEKKTRGASSVVGKPWGGGGGCAQSA